jgi:hypothetical protein
MRCVSIIGVVLFLCGFPVVLHAHSLTLAVGLDNFAYNSGDLNSINRFRLPTPVLLFDAGLEGEFSTFSSYNIKFSNDSILRYLASANTTFNLWFFRLGVGAFMPLFNGGKEEYIPGIIGSIGFEIPGGFSAYIEYGQNAFADLSESKGIHLNYGKVEATIWLPHIMFQLVVHRKSFIRMPAVTYTIRDSLLRYQVSVDFFPKSSSFLFGFGGGYESLEKAIEPVPNINSPVPLLENAVDRLFVLANISIKFTPSFGFFLNADVPLSATAAGIFLKAITGFRIVLSDF